jgi:hypothetical protein
MPPGVPVRLDRVEVRPAGLRRAGVKAVQRRGVKFGCKLKLTPDQARKLIDKGQACLCAADLLKGAARHRIGHLS